MTRPAHWAEVALAREYARQARGRESAANTGQIISAAVMICSCLTALGSFFSSEIVASPWAAIPLFGVTGVAWLANRHFTREHRRNTAEIREREERIRELESRMCE